MTDIHHATPAQIAAHRAHVARQQRMSGRIVQRSVVPESSPAPKEVIMRHRKITANDIKRAVADHFKVRVADIVSDRRTTEVIMPRQIGMFLTKELTPLSYPQIGRQFGGRDHTTVIHAFNKIAALLLTDASLAAAVDAIRASITWTK